MPFVPDDELLAELKAAFSIEAAEHLASLNRDLLALEREDSAEERQRLLKEIFRDAHSLKGGASAVDLQDVRLLAHHLESIFGKLQRDELAVEPDTFDVLYKTLDVIQRLVDEDGDASARADEVNGLVPRLALVESQGAAAVRRDAAQVPEGPRQDVPGTPEASQSAPAGSSDTVRIATSKLDTLMTHVGQLVVASGGSQRSLADVAAIEDDLEKLVKASRRPRGSTPPRTAQDAPADASASSAAVLADVLDRVHRLHGWIRADARRMSQVADHLQEEVLRARMLPVSTVFNSFPRMVRDLARDYGKQVRLEIRGADTEMDRAVLEQIKAPITHLLRNCIDHALEEPEGRAAAGKAPEGTVILSASQKGDSVVIEVTDDGAGVDIERVKATAIEKAVVNAAEVEEMGEREALSLIFRSGFSTSPLITSVSGRGIGLDVVRENVERLNGAIELESKPGRGATFSLIMPLTVATTRCVLARAGGQLLGLPLTNIVRTVRVSPQDVREAEGHEAIVLADGPLPLRDLAVVLGLKPPSWREGRRPVLIARFADRAVGLMVDEIVGVEEIVVKNLPLPLLKVRHAAGASVLGSGGVIVVLNLADVVRSALRPADMAGPSRRATERDATEPVKVLLVDDSITTRTLEKNILMSAGYDVRAAGDGADAWKAIHADPPDVVVTDVQMPVMDGFELTAKIRADDRFRHLPVVLVTSLESETDRERGVDVGADAYIGKSSFDQEQLLDVVRTLI